MNKGAVGVPVAARTRPNGWAWTTNARLTSKPIIADRLVAFASEDHKLYVAVNTPPSLLYRFLTPPRGRCLLTLVVRVFDNNRDQMLISEQETSHAATVRRARP